MQVRLLPTPIIWRHIEASKYGVGVVPRDKIIVGLKPPAL